MEEEKINEETSKPNEATGENPTVWSIVAGAAIDVIEGAEEGLSKEDIIKGVTENKKTVLIPREKIEELVDAVLFLLSKNGLLVNRSGLYFKRELKDTPAGQMMASRGVEIVRKGDENNDSETELKS